MIRLLRYIRPCEIIPRGWGFAFNGADSMGCFLAPIPLNFAIGLWWRFYWLLVRGLCRRRDYLDILKRVAWQEGHRRGWDEGYSAGIRHARILYTESPMSPGASV